MFSLSKNNLLNNSNAEDASYTILFGVLSVALSKIEFHIPGIGDSNLREIPLLICLFHLKNPLFIIGLSLSALAGSSAAIPMWIVFLVHFLPLLIASASFKLLDKRRLPSTTSGLLWMFITTGYYLILLLPFVIIALQLASPRTDKSFWNSYMTILPSLRFEIITSSLVTGLYLMQLEIRKNLVLMNKNLEKIVENRTAELTFANNELLSLNEELKASNEGIKRLNESLEQMVKERTDKINDQLNQLMKYAHMNSHEVRAPLARMLGLLQLIKHEDDPDLTKSLLDKLLNSSLELDNIIKEMNRLLEHEVGL